MHQWKRASWLKLREQKKGKGKPKITLIKVVKNDTLIKNMTKSMVSD